MDTAKGSSCPDTALDCLGNHATTCKRAGGGGEMSSYATTICALCFFYFCHCANLGVRVNLDSGLTPDLSHTRPVPVLNWKRTKHAAFDITVTSPLTPSILTAARVSEGAAAEEAEARKIVDWTELGWVCIPLVVETLWELGKRSPVYSRMPSSDLPTNVRLSLRSIAG